MNYNSNLQANNVELQALIDIANALPEAGGGGTNKDEIIAEFIKKDYTSIENSIASQIGNGAFAYCSKLTTVSLPACTTIGSSAFFNCFKLTSVNFPVCTTIGDYAFAYCYNLTPINFPVCTRIGYNAFTGCSKLTTVSLPACTTIGSSAFYNCFDLTTVSLPACMTISNYAFRDCRRLSSLTLGASTVCTLSNSDAFAKTPYAGYSNLFSGTPYIYVPASLVSAYQSATNWSYFSSYITAI